MRNICLKVCIQSQFKLVTPMTPIQWIDRWRDQRHRRKENQQSIHLTDEIIYFVLAIWEKLANVHLNVLSRHLHPMADRGVALGLQLTPLLNQGSQSSRLLPEIHWIIMAKSKGVRIIVTLECTECRTATAAEKRSSGVSRYTTTKNRRNNPERLELMKFCPQLNRMTLHREIK